MAFRPSKRLILAAITQLIIHSKTPPMLLSCHTCYTHTLLLLCSYSYKCESYSAGSDPDICSKCFKSVWYSTSIVPDCTDVQTPLGPTPLKHPQIPSVRYIIRRPRITEEVSRVAAPCAFSVVEGEDVDIGRLDGGGCLPEVVGVACFDAELGDIDAFEGVVGVVGVDDVLGCCVWTRVFTTSNGIVITPAIPPALAAFNISSGNPIFFDPV